MTNNFKNLNDDNNLANGFTNFEGDNLDNYLGHEMIEIKQNYVKSKITVKDHHKQPMGRDSGESFTRKNPEWSYPSPGTVDEAILKSVCNR